MNRLVRPLLWIGLGVAIGVGVMLANEPLLAGQNALLPPDNPTFLIKIVAPAGETSVECVSGCTFNEVKVFTDGTKRNFRVPSFQFGCRNQTCEWSAGGVITR
jgi:hypothetical protein